MKKNIILKEMVPYLMLAPALIIILIFKIYPIISVILESFFRNGSPSLRTYEILFGDRNFWGALGTTVKMNLVMIPLQIVISLCLALLVNSTIKGIGIFRSIYYLPVTMAISVASISWNLMANYNSGVFNSISTFWDLETGLFHRCETGVMVYCYDGYMERLWILDDVHFSRFKGCGYIYL